MRDLFAFTRRAALGALAAWTCACALAADPVDPARLAEAHALLGAMQLDQQIDGMTSAMAHVMSKQFTPGDGTNERVAQISMEEAMSGMKEQARAHGGLIDMMAEAYASQFTVDELRQIHDFYASPAGQRVLRAGPEIMRQLLPQMVSASRALAPRVCANVKARLIAEKIPAGDTMTCPAAP